MGSLWAGSSWGAWEVGTRSRGDTALCRPRPGDPTSVLVVCAHSLPEGHVPMFTLQVRKLRLLFRLTWHVSI